MKTWNDFDKFDDVLDEYLPDIGEGETQATQLATALCKLVYKWFNDGDVYDNTYHLSGWANDLSSYANWLYKHTFAKETLLSINGCVTEDDYTDLLYELCEQLAQKDYLEELNAEKSVDSVYTMDGPFEFYEWNEEEEYWDEEDEEEW